MSNTNVFLIKETLIISLARIFHVSKHEGGGGGGMWIDPPRLSLNLVTLK